MVYSNTQVGGTVTLEKNDNAFTVTAHPAENYEFRGFFDYNNPSVLVCSESTYSSVATEDVNLLAKFYAIVNFETSPQNAGSVTKQQDPISGVIIATAKSSDGYVFDRWLNKATNTVVSSSEVLAIMPNTPETYIACFRPQTNTHTIRIVKSEHGTITLENGKYSYEEGEQVKLIVTPESGWRLAVLAGLPENYDMDNQTFTMPGKHVTITAIFKEVRRLRVYANTLVGGTVTVETYPGSEFSATAHPAENYEFLGFFDYNNPNVLISSESTYSVIATENVDLLAKFYPIVNFEVSPQNTGSVTKERDPITGNITATAKPAKGYVFYKWLDKETNTVVNGMEGVSLSPSDPSTYVACFRPENSYFINTMATTHGSLIVENAKEYYMEGDAITLKAIPEEGYVLKGFSYSTEESLFKPMTGNTFLMPSHNTWVYAEFIRQYTVNVVASSEQGGSVAGGGKYKDGEKV